MTSLRLPYRSRKSTVIIDATTDRWRIVFSVAIILILMVSVHGTHAQSKGKGGPPMRPGIVSVAEIRQGESQPMSDFVGTVFFAQVSDVAAEVAGRANVVTFEEGQQVFSGMALVQLDTGLLNLTIKKNVALYEQARVELEDARTDLQRMESLYKGQSVAVSVYDTSRFRMQGLEQKVAALSYELEHDKLMRQKMTIRSPFDGVVIRKDVDVGEWVSDGATVWVIASYTEVDVVVDVPETILDFLETGREVPIQRGQRQFTGKIAAVVPRGDVATRTFSVKIRLPNEYQLIEGMEARTTLPSGPMVKGLLVPRDAVISKFGRPVVFVNVSGAAKMLPVQVQGYDGLMAGVAGPGLEAGMEAVVKGNERIRDGQPLKVIKQK